MILKKHRQPWSSPINCIISDGIGHSPLARISHISHCILHIAHHTLQIVYIYCKELKKGNARCNLLYECIAPILNAIDLSDTYCKQRIIGLMVGDNQE